MEALGLVLKPFVDFSFAPFDYTGNMNAERSCICAPSLHFPVGNTCGDILVLFAFQRIFSLLSSILIVELTVCSQ